MQIMPTVAHHLAKTMSTPALRPHERDALIQSLRAGVTPLLGAKHIQVGRDAELAAMETSLDRIASGGSVFKLLVGEYGAGKTFFMNVVRGSAMERHTQSTSKDVPNTEKWDWVLPDELFLAG